MDLTIYKTFSYSQETTLVQDKQKNKFNNPLKLNIEVAQNQKKFIFHNHRVKNITNDELLKLDFFQNQPKLNLFFIKHIINIKINYFTTYQKIKRLNKKINHINFINLFNIKTYQKLNLLNSIWILNINKNLKKTEQNATKLLIHNEVTSIKTLIYYGNLF